MSVSMLAEQLAQTGERVEVYTTTANGKDELAVDDGKVVSVDGVDVIYFKRITKDHTHFSPRLLLQLWRQGRQFDVVHIHGWWNTVSVLACWLAQKRGLTVIVSPRGMLSSYSFSNKNNSAKSLIHRLVGQKLLKKSFVHATSDNEYKAVSSLVKPKGIFNIPNFIRLDAVEHSHERLEGNGLKIIFFSRVEEKKGLDILLEALRYVNIPFQLTIAGSGEPEYINRLKKIATEHSIDDRMEWIGFQTGKKFEILAEHDLMVLPSYDENFGNVVIESLSAGTAVLISKQVGLADYVTEKQLGWVCDLNEQSFAEAINNTYMQKAKLSEIRNQAPSIIRNDFDANKIVARYIGMYHEVLNRSTAHSN
jgi:glycosyltransferase involved in cell wall biosynthesis